MQSIRGVQRLASGGQIGAERIGVVGENGVEIEDMEHCSKALCK